MNAMHKTLMGIVLGGVMMAGSAAAQNEHEQHQAQQGKPEAGMACCAGENAKPGEQGRMGMMGQMGASGDKSDAMASCPHHQAGALADQLIASHEAMVKETDMAALKLKLAAHGNLLQQLKTAASASCPMMGEGGMGGMGGGMGGMKH